MELYGADVRCDVISEVAVVLGLVVNAVVVVMVGDVIVDDVLVVFSPQSTREIVSNPNNKAHTKKTGFILKNSNSDSIKSTEISAFCSKPRYKVTKHDVIAKGFHYQIKQSSN